MVKMGVFKATGGQKPPGLPNTVNYHLPCLLRVLEEIARLIEGHGN